MNLFSFKYPVHSVLAKEILSVFPAVQKIWVIQNSGHVQQSKLFEIDHQREEHIAMINNFTTLSFKGNKEFRWIGMDEIPYNAETKKQNQYNLFDEYKNNILQVELADPNQKECFMLYAFFNENNSKSGVQSDGRFSTDNKQLVGMAVINLLKYRYKSYVDDNKTLENIVEMQQRLVGQASNEYKEKGFKEKYIEEQLSVISEKVHQKIAISDEAMDYLVNQNNTPNLLTQIIEEAVSWIVNFSVSQKQLMIEAGHVMRESLAPARESFEKKHSEKYNRTFELLERLERSAERIVISNMRLTGNNVGQNMETPISAPAITDALKKHAGKIRTLTKLYPDNWPILRSKFKPFQNVLEAAPDDNIFTASA